jgi:hypothetical protein
MRATIELVLDDRGALVGARGVDRALDSLGATADKSAKRFDAAFGSALRSADSRVRGFVSGTVQSFLGNALANAAGKLAASTSDFFKGSLDAAKEASDAQRFLSNAVKETGSSLTSATQDARAFAASFGVTLSEAQRLQATAQLGLQGTGTDPTEFLNRAADLLASRGRSLSELQTVVGQLFAGSDEGIGRLLGGGENPSTIWEAYAQSVGKSAAALTDLEKKQAVVNVVLERGAAQAGAARSRLEEYGGQVDQIGSLFTDMEAAFGRFILSNEGVRQVMGGIRDGLKGANDEGSQFQRFLSSVGPQIGDMAQAFALVGGRIAEAFVRAQFGVGMVQRGFDLLGTFLDKIAVEFELSMLRAVRSVLESARSTLPESVSSFLGLRDPKELTGAIQIRENALAGINERGQNLVRSADQFEQDMEARIAAIRAATDSAVERAAAFGRFATDKPEDTIIRARGIDFKKFDAARAAAAAVATGPVASVVDGVPTLVSVQTTDTGLTETVEDGIATLRGLPRQVADATNRAVNGDDKESLKSEVKRLRDELARVASGGVVATVIAKAEQGTSISSFAQAGDGQPYGALPAQPAR